MQSKLLPHKPEYLKTTAIIATCFRDTPLLDYTEEWVRPHSGAREIRTYGKASREIPIQRYFKAFGFSFRGIKGRKYVCVNRRRTYAARGLYFIRLL